MRSFLIGIVAGAILASAFSAWGQAGFGRWIVPGTNNLAATDAYCCLTAVVRGRELPLTNCLKLPHPITKEDGP